MAVGWIDIVVNNTDSAWHLKSVDDRHNGALKGGGDHFELDDKGFHQIRPRTQYDADWCGIPWYHQGKHYKSISKDKEKEVIFYTSWKDGKNWIMFEEGDTRRPLGRLQAPETDFHCYLRFELNDVIIDIVNDDGSTQKALTQIFDEVKGWIEVLAPLLAAKIKSASSK
ncbi:MAG: hypothetical protein KC553_12790 [Nitrospina sp.]|nr:hypothetical protein [Nitrospina sp.]